MLLGENNPSGPMTSSLSALLLEAMVAEGLDFEIDFLSLLAAVLFEAWKEGKNGGIQ